ncbi:MAG: hypothetical protein K0R71_752 [Bacillales bacterium]|jgi:hypothetical protein|nr:hypothetical protein [Bacillales bacterium]
MDHLKVYKISLNPILLFFFTGLFFFLLSLMVLIESFTNFAKTMSSLGGVIFSIVLFYYTYNLLKMRKEGKGYFWDSEGIVIDFEGNKVYWFEIESIKYFNYKSGRSTVIYPHYSYHEKIRIRRKKRLGTPAHTIDWFTIENSKEFHDNLMKAWEDQVFRSV